MCNSNICSSNTYIYDTKSWNINTTNAIYIFKPHTMLTPVSEAIELYIIILQTLYAVRLSLYMIYSLVYTCSSSNTYSENTVHVDE